MNQKYQVDSANFSRICIDYKNDNVKFKIIGEENIFKLAISGYLKKFFPIIKFLLVFYIGYRSNFYIHNNSSDNYYV